MATIDGRPAKYGISLKELRELMEYRGREGLTRIHNFGGNIGIMEKLYTSEDRGLSGNRPDIDHRRETFGSNIIPPKPPKTFIQLVCEAVQDITLIILIVAALVSLGLSFYKPEDEQCKYFLYQFSTHIFHSFSFTFNLRKNKIYFLDFLLIELIKLKILNPFNS